MYCQIGKYPNPLKPECYLDQLGLNFQKKMQQYAKALVQVSFSCWLDCFLRFCSHANYATLVGGHD